MRMELLDTVRRHCLADIAEALDAVEMDDNARSAVLESLTEAFDSVLIAFENEPLPHATKAAVAQFAFLRLWPRMLVRMAPAMVMLATQRADVARKATVAIEARMAS